MHNTYFHTQLLGRIYGTPGTSSEAAAAWFKFATQLHKLCQLYNINWIYLTFFCNITNILLSGGAANIAFLKVEDVRLKRMDNFEKPIW